MATFTLLGYFFGNTPFVQENFELVIIAIIAISLVPAVVEAVKARRELDSSERSTPYLTWLRRGGGGPTKGADHGDQHEGRMMR